jgi:KaiC/GvpD/RAD55 family RecA-like ATPase
MTPRDAARFYAALGLCPIPIEPRGKRPLVAWREYQDRVPTPAEIEAWWQLHPDANVGLVAGRGVVVVDCDTPEAVERVSALVPPETPRVQTAKGMHFYCRGEMGDRIRALPGVDIRGRGYVVAPPSVHESGFVYRWLQAPASGPETWPPVPAALVATDHETPAAESRTWIEEALAGVDEGQRDTTCARLAGYFWGKGLSEPVIEAILVSWGERCRPPFPESEVRKCVASITRREGGPESLTRSLETLVPEAVAEIRSPAPRIVPTRLPALDEVLSGGWRPGDYVLLGARPGVGKTALALQIARTAAESGLRVLICSREMTPQALVRRLLAQASGVRLQSLRTGTLTAIEERMLAQGAEHLARLPIYVTNTRTVPALEAECREIGDLSLVIVDYLQLMVASVRESRQRVEEISEGLKDLAVRNETTVLALSSLSRPPKDRPNWVPSMGDLRESGELEHDADVILLMHRPDLGAPECSIQVAKHRDGGIGRIPVSFDGAHMTFTESSEEADHGTVEGV